MIEAIIEDDEIKRRMFRSLDDALDESVILASNTSSIPIAGLAAATHRPDRVIGLHFFSPVPVMKLVEIVVALDTAAATIDRAETFVTQIGKRPIRTKDRSGFIVNMLLVPYLMAAVRMYEDGFASREDIDEGMRLGCGHPMGPLSLCDFIGLDVLYAVCDSLYEEFKRAEFAPPPLMKRMVALGHLGRKTGRGSTSTPPGAGRRRSGAWPGRSTRIRAGRCCVTAATQPCAGSRIDRGATMRLLLALAGAQQAARLERGARAASSGPSAPRRRSSTSTASPPAASRRTVCSAPIRAEWTSSRAPPGRRCPGAASQMRSSSARPSRPASQARSGPAARQLVASGRAGRAGWRRSRRSARRPPARTGRRAARARARRSAGR